MTGSCPLPSSNPPPPSRAFPAPPLFAPLPPRLFPRPGPRTCWWCQSATDNTEHCSSARLPWFWVSGYYRKWRFQGTFHSSSLRRNSLAPNISQKVNGKWGARPSASRLMAMTNGSDVNTHVLGVTSPALALMVEEYTRTLNRPGAVPCVQRTWQLYVDNKCLAASSMCLGLYEDEMNRQLGKKGLPCDEAVVRDAHLEASLLSTQHFEFETIGLELHNSWSFLEELGVCLLTYTRLLSLSESWGRNHGWRSTGNEASSPSPRCPQFGPSSPRVRNSGTQGSWVLN